MKALRWIADRWYIPLLAVAAVAGWYFTRDKGSPLKRVRDELKVIEVGAAARKVQAEMGKDKALALVEAARERELETLDAKQKLKAEKLKSDPVALSRLLARHGNRN